MTTIHVPARVGPIDPLQASKTASSFASALRGCATAVSDVTSWTRAHGVPANWSGNAADAADHAMTIFARDCDAMTAALEKATTACDVYADQVVQLHEDRDQLVTDRVDLNKAIDDLIADIEGADASQTEPLQARADRLKERVDHLVERIDTFWKRVERAEDRVIAALTSVDTVGEGAKAATGKGRVDTAALKDELAGLGDDADAVNDWWKDLSPAEREALKISDPDLVGNTNGIPTGDRDESNRTSLARDLDRLRNVPEDELSTEEKELLKRAEAAEDALALPGSDKDRNTGEPVDVNLLVYQPAAFDGDGAVAVSYGDPDTADNTAVIVPGITNDGSTIVGNAEDAYRLFDEANQKGDSMATIAWMGYDAPSVNPADAWDTPEEIWDMGSVITEDKAEAGGLLLSQFVDGLRATDEGERSHLSVIGHSYGSTTAANAAHDHGLHADSLTLIGSPGASGGVHDVSDLGMPEGKVYVGSADNDFVTWLGREGDVGMGEDPAQKDFGAKVFPVDPGPEFHADDIGQGIENHTSYFNPDSTSLANLTEIVQGDEPQVVEGREKDANDYAFDWVKDEVTYQVEKEIETTKEEIKDSWDKGTDWVGDRYDDFSGLWR
ncbi:hypothetical protein DDE18_14160 [Nocardioides gansuensis]|uniref:DUF1023 domain-containing protein n=1 Tax=Nocardioides gansuensis TaxID=2138300 RepID=A0A2T8F819_9ACTN|nr:alpha/beta hydrolase [Nocardioides gansuensis]PVG81862.1 hypothetical protein DDE18_14160 [Nocardioides gansuensis]